MSCKLAMWHIYLISTVSAVPPWVNSTNMQKTVLDFKKSSFGKKCHFSWKTPKIKGRWRVKVYIYIGFLIQCLGILFHFSTNPSGLWHVLPQCFRPWSHLCILLVAGLASATLICRRPRKKMLMIIAIFGSNPVKTTHNHHVHLCLGLFWYAMSFCYCCESVSLTWWPGLWSLPAMLCRLCPGTLQETCPGSYLDMQIHVANRSASALSTCWDHVVCRCCTYPLVN